MKHEGDPSKSNFVTIAYTRGNKVYRLKARSVVMAGGCWTTKLVVRDLPSDHRQAYDQFYRSPCMMANVALRNWRSFTNWGSQDASGLKAWAALPRFERCPHFRPTTKPSVRILPWSSRSKFFFLITASRSRNKAILDAHELLSTSFRDYERQIRAQMTEMFSASGFDATRDIAGIVLNRWGHAYVSPQPGFFFGKDGNPAPREILRAMPFGRIAFANTDLSGAPDHRTAIGEAHRAVSQLLDRVLTGVA